jgi:hypothetical protein
VRALVGASTGYPASANRDSTAAADVVRSSNSTSTRFVAGSTWTDRTPSNFDRTVRTLFAHPPQRIALDLSVMFILLPLRKKVSLPVT